MMHRRIGAGYNGELAIRLLPDLRKPFRISRLPPLPEPEPPDVDSLLKQFAQSSQLGANAAYIEDL